MTYTKGWSAWNLTSGCGADFSVTSIEVTEKGGMSPEKTIKADHPFVFVIAGKNDSVPILFGGVYTGV